MLANQGQSGVSVIMLNPVSAANTAAATSGWFDVRGYEGDIVITQQVGGMTGAVVAVVEDATDITGTGASPMVPNEGNFVIVLAANNLQKRTFNAGATRGFLRYIGTITTGPALIAANFMACPKYTV